MELFQPISSPFPSKYQVPQFKFWAPHPFRNSIQISCLQRKCLIPWSPWAEILQGNSLWKITLVHQNLSHSIKPIFLRKLSKFLSRLEHCKGSAIFLIMQMVWNFYSVSIRLIYWSSQNLGHFHLANSSESSGFYFWPVWHFVKEVLSLLIQLSWNLAA